MSCAACGSQTRGEVLPVEAVDGARPLGHPNAFGLRTDGVLAVFDVCTSCGLSTLRRLARPDRPFG